MWAFSFRLSRSVISVAIGMLIWGSAAAGVASRSGVAVRAGSLRNSSSMSSSSSSGSTDSASALFR